MTDYVTSFQTVNFKLYTSQFDQLEQIIVCFFLQFFLTKCCHTMFLLKEKSASHVRCHIMLSAFRLFILNCNTCILCSHYLPFSFHVHCSFIHQYC